MTFEDHILFKGTRTLPIGFPAVRVFFRLHAAISRWGMFHVVSSLLNFMRVQWWVHLGKLRNQWPSTAINMGIIQREGVVGGCFESCFLSRKCMKLLQLYTYFPGLFGPVALTVSYQKPKNFKAFGWKGKLQPLSIQNSGSPNDHQRLPGYLQKMFKLYRTAGLPNDLSWVPLFSRTTNCHLADLVCCTAGKKHIV